MRLPKISKVTQGMDFEASITTSKRMTLYHRTSRERAKQIMKDGFNEGVGHYLTDELHEGVWLSDRPLDSNEGADGDTLLVIDVEIADAELSDFEWVEEVRRIANGLFRLKLSTHESVH
jgi:hypothetical protein